VLDLPWERVHAEAEVLEHAISNYLLDAIDRKLGFPKADLHGDPIPASDLTMLRPDTRSVGTLEPGQTGTLVRVADDDPEIPRHLSESGIALGDIVTVTVCDRFGGSLTVRVASTTHSFAPRRAAPRRASPRPRHARHGVGALSADPHRVSRLRYARA